jgi:hypothetical protein
LGVPLKPNRGKYASDPDRAVAQQLADLMQSCAHCRAPLRGHEYALLATWAISEEKDGALARFFEAIKEHDWLKLREFQSWLGNTDDLEAYAVRCSGQNLTVAVIKTHFELFQGARLLCTESLSAMDRSKLLDSFPDLQWHAF